MLSNLKFHLLVCFLFLWGACVFAAGPHETPANRVASLYISQDFINSQLKSHLKAQLVKSLQLVLDPDKDGIFFRGVLQVPIEELRAVNLDPTLGEFNFQASIKLEATKEGFLILEFPLSETFLYPATAKHPEQEKIIVPVQLVSVALAAARGYLAAISGDFSGFDKREAKLEALKKAIDHSIAREKNPDALEEMKNQRESLRIQLAAIPVERKQLEATSKQVAKVLGLVGEKELNLNQELGGRKNALILKIKISQIAPYLEGVELGGLRIVHDKKDGTGQNYFVLDMNSTLGGQIQAPSAQASAPREPMKNPPALIMRLNQSLFESDAVLDAEKKAGGNKIRDLNFALKDDGLHVNGTYKFIFFHVGFDTIVDFVSTSTDQFEVRVRDIKVAGIDFEFLSKLILESVEKRLSKAMRGMCTFNYLGKEQDHARALQVNVDTKKMIPAFPNLHLVAVDVRDREFLLKIGQP